MNLLQTSHLIIKLLIKLFTTRQPMFSFQNFVLHFICTIFFWIYFFNLKVHGKIYQRFLSGFFLLHNHNNIGIYYKKQVIGKSFTRADKKPLEKWDIQLKYHLLYHIKKKYFSKHEFYKFFYYFSVLLIATDRL